MVNVKTEIIEVEHGHTAYILTRDMSHVIEILKRL